MSKTFKSSYMSDGSQLEIESSIASNSFHITLCTAVSEKSFNFRNSDAPALALAILEAAGVEAIDPASKQVRFGTPEHLGQIAFDLARCIKEQERATADAKEQAELEAEALELFRASQCIRTDGMYAYVPPFAELSDPSKTKWLAVARKAREMAKDATE